MASVTFSKIDKSYGTTQVIKNLNLEIADEEFMVLVGPSGCGKSTALRMIAGLEEVTGGEIKIADRVVNDLAPKDRDIAMVFQSYALYPHMTVRENLEFGLKMRKLPAEQIKKLVDEAAEILGITHLLDRKPKQLSGGQRQRVAVGRAIVRKPSVFLFDEPLSNLDAKLRVQMRAEISKLQQRLKTTTVYVTHDQVEAMTMGHRIAVMKDGYLMQVGTPPELYERPVNLFVASFIGTPPMNFWNAALSPDALGLQATKFALPVPQVWRAAAAGKGGREVIVGMRPENIFESAGGGGRGELATLSGTVEIVEPLGHEAIVYVRVGDDLIAARFYPHRAPKAGATVELSLEVDNMHLYDAETEKRLSA